jgi:hypothetical protein
MRGLHTVENGDVDIHNDDVGLKGLDSLERLCAILSLANNVQVVRACQNVPQSLSKERMIINNEHSYFLHALMPHRQNVRWFVQSMLHHLPTKNQDSRYPGGMRIFCPADKIAPGAN